MKLLTSNFPKTLTKIYKFETNRVKDRENTSKYRHRWVFTVRLDAQEITRAAIDRKVFVNASEKKSKQIIMLKSQLSANLLPAIH